MGSGTILRTRVNDNYFTHTKNDSICNVTIKREEILIIAHHVFPTTSTNRCNPYIQEPQTKL